MGFFCARISACSAILRSAIIQAIPGEETLYYHNDHLGTPQAMTDAAGTVVWKADYLPSGEAMVDEDPDGDYLPVTNNLRFPGQYFDVETALHYNWHRDYYPGLGRYIETDPVGLEDGTNQYEYANCNPLFFSDSLGLFAFNPADHVPRGGNPPEPPQSVSCCENGKQVSKVSIWVCRRRLIKPDSWIPMIGPLSHTYIACKNPYENPGTKEVFGKQPRRANHGNPLWGPGYVERDPYDEDFKHCKERKLCPADKHRMCTEGPTDQPYFILSPWHNCHGWGAGRSS